MKKKKAGNRQRKEATNTASKGPSKPVNNLKNVFNFLVASIIGVSAVCAVATFAWWRQKKAVEKIEASNTSVVGAIVKVGSMKGSYAVAEYTVNGKVYQISNNSPASNIYVGEYYEVIYDASSPEESRINYSKPIFLEDQITGTTVGTITSKSFATVGFRYSVNSEDIKRWQTCPDVDLIDIGDVYMVEYLASNPRIAILRVESGFRGD